jgi:hypothetical protein
VLILYYSQPPISPKRATTFHLKPLNIKKTVTLNNTNGIKILAWDKHTTFSGFKPVKEIPTLPLFLIGYPAGI